MLRVGLEHFGDGMNVKLDTYGPDVFQGIMGPVELKAGGYIELEMDFEGEFVNTPFEARALAMELLKAADALEKHLERR